MSGRAPHLSPDALYHLVTVDLWRDYETVGQIAPPSLDQEGFVHCSWGHQVAGTMAKHFSVAAEVMALRLDPALLGAPVVEEDLYGSGRRFPHVYSSIPLAAVLEVEQVR